METEPNLLELWRKNKWMILLALIGLIFAVCVITYGFFQAVFIFCCIVLGAWCGMKLDRYLAKKRRGE